MPPRTPPIMPSSAATNTPDVSAPLTEATEAEAAQATDPQKQRPRLDPTRYGDWELNGKCVDF